MGTLRVLSARSGDDRTVWGTTATETTNAEAWAAVREVERIFATTMARGAIAVKITAGLPPERIERFDAMAEQIILIPPVVGG